MANVRWIVTDMDDTLIKHYGTPTDKVRNLWNKLRQDSGNCLILATGQSHLKVIEKFSLNGMHLPDYIIANQGSVIYRTKTNEIVRVFTLTYPKVFPILQQFLKIGGLKELIRVCTLDKVIVLDTQEARSFYEKNPQSNVEFTSDIWRVIQEEKYNKLVLSAPLTIVEQMLSYSFEVEGMTLLNSGETKYGGEDYYRFEIVSSNKKIALDHLFSSWCKTRRNLNGTHVLCLGDEISDYGLAEFALLANSMKYSTGYFAIINSGSKGNICLREKIEKKAKLINCEERLIFAPNVENDG